MHAVLHFPQGSQRLPRVDLNRQPPSGRLPDFRIFQAQESRYTRTRQVDVKNTYRVAGQAERERELGGDGGFADPAFAAEDEYDILDVVERHVEE